MTAAKAEQPIETDQAAATSAVEQVEGEIRAFVRRDVSVFRRHQHDGSRNPAENESQNSEACPISHDTSLLSAR